VPQGSVSQYSIYYTPNLLVALSFITTTFITTYADDTAVFVAHNNYIDPCDYEKASIIEMTEKNRESKPAEQNLYK